MTNVWLKNKAVIWSLIFVFLFTSVFSSSTVFAETAEAQTGAASYVDDIIIYSSEYDAIYPNLDEMTADGELDIIIPSYYVESELTLDVGCISGASIYDMETNEDYGAYESFAINGLEAGGTTYLAFGIDPTDGSEAHTYCIGICATGGTEGEGEGSTEPDVGSINLREADSTISSDNKYLHFEFTLLNDAEINEAYLALRCLETEDASGIRTTDIAYDEESGKYIATFEIPDFAEGRCSISDFMIDDYDCYEDDDTFYFYVEPSYAEGIVIDSINFESGFDGEINLTEDYLQETVNVTVSATVTGEAPDFIYATFENSEAYEDSIGIGLEYNSETGLYEGSYTFQFDNREGTYTLEKVELGWEKIKLNFEEMPVIALTKSSTDTIAPVISDAYFTLNGVKCEEMGFSVTEEQLANEDLVLWVEASDESDIIDATVNMSYEEGATTGRGLDYDEESGLYYCAFYNMTDYSEWWIDNIYFCDKYGNETECTELNGKKLDMMYFYIGEAVQPEEYECTFDFYTLDQGVVTYNVACKAVTSFAEMGKTLPDPVEIDGATFLGWECEDILITDETQQFRLKDRDTYGFRPKYDKKIVALDIEYINEENEYTTVNKLYIVDDSTTFGEFKTELFENGELAGFENCSDSTFLRWGYEGYTDDTAFGEGVTRISFWAEYEDAEGGGDEGGDVVTSYPEYVWLIYSVNQIEVEEYVDFEDVTTKECHIPYSYNKDGGIMLRWEDENGDYAGADVESLAGGSGSVSFEYNETTYTVNVIVDEPSADTDCQIYVFNNDGQGFYVDTEAAATEAGDTVVLPYGSFGGSYICAIPAHDGTDFDESMEFVQGDYNYYYKKDLSVDDNGDCVVSFTVTAENGNTKTYKVKVVEDPGDEIAIEQMYAYFWDGKTYEESYDGELEKVYAGVHLDMEKAATEEGLTVKVPYFYNNDYGFTIEDDYDEYDFTGISFNEPYYLNEDGTMTLEFSALSPNGNNTENYKLNFVKDTDGSGTGISRLEYYWGQTDPETGETLKRVVADIDAEAAKSEEGATIVVPAEMATSDCYDMWIAADSDNYSRFEESYYSEEDGMTYVSYSFSHIFDYPQVTEEGATWEFTVTSPDGQTEETYRFNIVPAVIPECALEDHTYGEYIVEKPGTCTEPTIMSQYCTVCGSKLTMNMFKGHSLGAWEYDETQHWKTCGDCYETVSAGEHEFTSEVTPPTCTAEGYTTYTCKCGYSYTADEIAVIDHSYGAWTQTKAPTCTEEGTEAKTCAGCGKTVTQAIPATGHVTLTKTPAKAATCTEAGNIEYYTCECGELFADADAVKEITAKDTVIAKLGHDYKAVVTAPTCTKGGYTTHTCSVCGHSYTDSAKAALGHSYGGWIIDKAATLDGAGSRHKDCTRGDDRITESIAQIGTVKISYSKKVYTGSAIKAPELTVEDVNGKALAAGTDYDVTGLKNNTKVGKYTVTVKFKGNYDGESAMTYTIVPKKPSSASANLSTTTTPASSRYDDIKFSWKASTGASGYMVYYKKASASSYTYLTSTTKTYYTKKNLSDGVKYTFKVVPYFKSGTTKYYSTAQYKAASVYTLKKVATPTVTKSGTKAKVKWKNINGETGYQISRSTSKTGTKIVATYKTTSGTYKTVTATKGKKYYYKVRAYKKIGTKTVYGPWSAAKAYTRK